MEMITALIKEASGNGHDKVFIVENLPKKLLLQRVPKMVPIKDTLTGRNTGDLMPSPTGETVEEPLPGIELSQNGDKGYVFNTNLGAAVDALKAIDRYIASLTPRDIKLPERVCYAQDPADPRSARIDREAIPVVSLPVPEDLRASAVEVVSPQAAPVASPSPASPTITTAAPPSLSPEEEAKKQAARDRMAKARAARHSVGSGAS